MHRSVHHWLRQVSRREVLQLAAGLGVSYLLPGLEARSAERRGSERPTSLITLWMAGGQSHLDSWDPHPETEHGGGIQPIKTTAPEIQIAHTLPQMAEQMRHLSVIRSLVSKEGDHQRGTYFVQTGYRPDPTTIHPAMTALVARLMTNPNIEIPQHVALATGDNFSVPRGGYLGDQYDAFRIFDPGNNIRNMRRQVDEKRQERRLEGLGIVSSAFSKQRALQVEATLHEHVVQQALTMMTSDQLQALELDDETEETKQRYGDSRFGRGCLVARRLVELGVRAVQVTLQGFDTHINNFEGQKAQSEILDPAFASLVQDLVDRDLWDSTIVLCIGEFGRTPWLNVNAGRDHWPVGFSCVVGGGGLNSGVLIGATNPELAYGERQRPQAEKTHPADPIKVQDLYATILSRLGLNPAEELITPIGRPLALADGSPIARLLPGGA
ncbi:MAG: DUF1501 domain-containing protein [Planctomycetaceae bacterium]|nr:DUF1501 domain-containing protein [Planctomycetaceae bacterium]